MLGPVRQSDKRARIEIGELWEEGDRVWESIVANRSESHLCHHIGEHTVLCFDIAVSTLSNVYVLPFCTPVGLLLLHASIIGP